MSVIRQRILKCEICGEPITDPLELMYCSPQCKQQALREGRHASSQRNVKHPTMPAGIAYRRYDGELIIARVRGQSPGSFHIEDNGGDRAIARVEVLYEFSKETDVRKAKELVTEYLKTVDEAARQLSISLSEVGRSES